MNPEIQQLNTEKEKLNSYRDCNFTPDIWHTLETLERTTTEIETQLEKFCEEIK